MFGSYNPPHDGHVATARRAFEKAGLDRVLFLPVPASALKRGVLQATFNQKVRMCEIVAAPHADWLGVSEDCKDIKSTPFAQLSAMKKILIDKHTAEPQNELYLIGGNDVAEKMVKAAALLTALTNMARGAQKYMPLDIAIYNRMIDRLVSTLEVLEKTPIVECEHTPGVSSTMLRESLTAGQRPDFISRELFDYIRE